MVVWACLSCKSSVPSAGELLRSVQVFHLCSRTSKLAPIFVTPLRLQHDASPTRWPPIPLPMRLVECSQGFGRPICGRTDVRVLRMKTEQRTMTLMILGENEIIRGEREKSGPPVRESSMRTLRVSDMTAFFKRHLHISKICQMTDASSQSALLSWRSRLAIFLSPTTWPGFSTSRAGVPRRASSPSRRPVSISLYPKREQRG
jgi:hypothetical protein